jgi:hypothetical protein
MPYIFGPMFADLGSLLITLVWILTLPRIPCGWFLVRPGDLLVSMVGPPVAVACPQAFDGYPSVPACPTVPAKVWCKILRAAL